MKILTIGNSFTWSLHEFFPAITESTGDELTLQFANHGGCELHRHWEYITNEERDAVYRMYDGKRMRELLAAEQWDIVTIQQASHASWRPETFEPFAGNIIDYVRKHAPQAEIVVQQTWAYRADDPRIRPDGAWGIDQTEMYNRLTANYRDLAKRYGLRIIPTGYAVQLARQNEEKPFVLYDKEVLNTLRWPDLPSQAGDVVGRLWWCKDKKQGNMFIGADHIHLNLRGQYLQCCVWYAALYGKKTSEITFVPETISDSDAEFLRRMAQKAVDEFTV